MKPDPLSQTAPRSPYAETPDASRGRLIPEAPSRTRSAFARDRDRFIHCTAFRRLKEKTQVFVAHEGDHYRTRLTHSLEVSQIARSLAHALGLDQDLAETIALAHDLGHTPFGHAGEDELQARMVAWGGFDHNVQTFRVVTDLEVRYPAWRGLNLTWETLEGVIKHNGPVTHRLEDPAWKAIADYGRGWDLSLDGFASLEAQCAAIADDIAYNNHDVDDGVQAGLFTLADLGVLRRFLYERMYRHYRVNRTRSQARRILAEMFQLFMAEPEVLPTEWAFAAEGTEARRARAVCDYIAGMTDRYAIGEHSRLFNLDIGLDL